MPAGQVPELHLSLAGLQQQPLVLVIQRLCFAVLSAYWQQTQYYSTVAGPTGRYQQFTAARRADADMCLTAVATAALQEAKAMYAEMRRLDAEALQITRQLGCQQCMPEAATDSDTLLGSSFDQIDPAERAVFEQLHVSSLWPAQQQQGEQVQGR